MKAEAIVVGVGAGMSNAAGFPYRGERFTKHYADFIEKYRFFDLLQACLCHFTNIREYWAFHSRFSLQNYFDQPNKTAYVYLHNLLKDKNYQLITTNADKSFDRAQFDRNRLFFVQGEYGLWQCSKFCHNKVYYREKTVREMVRLQKDMKIPKDLVPYCPKCGAHMEINKRKEIGMVEDEYFIRQKNRYEQFLNDVSQLKTAYLEIGVGNTVPQFIKHPFQKMVEKNKKGLYITLNQREYFIPHEIRNRTVHLKDDIKLILRDATK